MANLRGGSNINGLPILGKSGSVNYVSKFSSSNELINSSLYENVTGVGIGNTNPTEKLEVTGNVKATSFIGNFTGNLSGNASTAGYATSSGTLQTSRTISLTGDASGSVGFDGSGNVSMNTNLTNSGVIAARTDGTKAFVLEIRTSDPVSPVQGQMWYRSDRDV